MATNAASAARRRLERRAEASTTGNSLRIVNLPEGVKFLSIKSAEPRRLDILEYDVTENHNKFARPGEKGYERTYYRHGNLGPDGKAMAICLRETFGEKCPVCDYMKTLSKDDENDRNTWKSLRAKERQLFNVVDVTDTESGVQVWDVSYHLFGKKLDAKLELADEEDDYVSFCSKGDDGKTLKLGFEEKSMGGDSKFYEVSSIDFKKRTSDYSKTETHNLDKLLGHPTYDEVKAVMEGVSAPAATETTTETAPAKAASSADDCPGGGTFGKDCDKFEACKKCGKWDKCDDETNPS